MTSKEKKIQTVLELVFVQGRIAELKDSKSYFDSSVAYRKRLTALEDKLEKLEDKVEDNDEGSEKVVVKFNVAAEDLRDNFDGEDFIQILKRTKII
jgi:hypothetical protein